MEGKLFKLEPCQWHWPTTDFYQWCKVEFEKEGFNSSSSTLKEFLDMCGHLEETEMHKSIAKKIAHAQKDHDKSMKAKGKVRHHAKSDFHHKRHHGSQKCHSGKCKKMFSNNRGLCRHNTNACNTYKC
eukprot:9767596-Ditylum_brightwellii.AAC.1